DLRRPGEPGAHPPVVEGDLDDQDVVGGHIGSPRAVQRDRALGDREVADHAVPASERPCLISSSSSATSSGAASTSGGRTGPTSSPPSRTPALTSATAYPGTLERSRTSGS